MDENKSIIMEYEQKRQTVSRLEKRRKELIKSCEKADWDSEHPVICLSRAFDDTVRTSEENEEWYSFDEILDEGYCSGEYCRNCVDAYKLKINDLADARKSFGDVKRKLSVIGKRIINT